MSRLGGITYGRVSHGIEIPRPSWKESASLDEVAKLIKPAVDN